MGRVVDMKVEDEPSSNTPNEIRKFWSNTEKQNSSGVIGSDNNNNSRYPPQPAPLPKHNGRHFPSAAGRVNVPPPLPPKSVQNNNEPVIASTRNNDNQRSGIRPLVQFNRSDFKHLRDKVAQLLVEQDRRGDGLLVKKNEPDYPTEVPPPLPPKPNHLRHSTLLPRDQTFQNRVPIIRQPPPRPPPPIPQRLGGNNGQQSIISTDTSSNGNGECLQCRDFSTVDSHAELTLPRHTVSSIPQLASELTSPFPAKVDKARVILTWLHHNVQYDVNSYFRGDIKRKVPMETVHTGLAVCQGYAELFEALCKAVGIEAIVVTGHGKGYGYLPLAPGEPVPQYKSNHAWNAVKFDDGMWHLIDACWGAGFVNGTSYTKCFKPSFFTRSAESFGKRHFPGDAIYQLLRSPKSWEEYMTEDFGPLLYSTFEQLTEFSEEKVKPWTTSISSSPPRMITFTLQNKCHHKPIVPLNQYILELFVDGKEVTHFEHDGKGFIWTAQIESAKLRKGGQVVVYAITNMNGRDGKGLTLEDYKRMKGHSTRSFGGLVMWKVT